MGLKLRLFLVIVIPLVLVVGVYGVVRIRVERGERLDDNRRNMSLTAKAIQIAVENALRHRQVSEIERLLAELVEGQDQIDRVRLFDAAARPTLVSNPLSLGPEIAETTTRQVIATGYPEWFYQHHGPQPALYYVVPLRGQKGAIDGALEIVQLTSNVEARARTAIWDVAVRLGLLLATIAVLTGVMLQRQVLRPLFRLMEGIRQLGEGRPGPPLPIDRGDELGHVAEAFNTMAGQLETARRQLLAETERALDLERQVRHAQTLAVAGRLASALAHEVGTPLNIISGRAEVVSRTLPEGDRRRDELAVIIRQIDRISGIIRALLDTVRPAKPEVQRVDVREIVGPLVPLLGYAARRNGVELETTIPGDVPAVLGDANQLQQVVINLVMNAVEAARPAGRVHLNVSGGEHDGRRGVVVSIADTGPGIPADVAGRVFEPFFTTKPAGQGTGLGLTICRDIVKEHDGEITLDSAPGRGTTVRVWLPAHDEAHE